MTEEEERERNSYYEAFDEIIARLDALAKTITPSTDDDGTPPEPVERPKCNSYFASFSEMADALARVGSAIVERQAVMDGNDAEFPDWRDESTAVRLGKGSSAESNGIAVGLNAAARQGTGTYATDAGAVALGKASSANGRDAVAIGRGAIAGTTSARTTKPTVQLGSGTNSADGTLQFRSWRLVGTDGLVPRERLPDDAGGVVNSTSTYGTAADRTNGMQYAVFTTEGLGVAEESVVVKGFSVVCHNVQGLPSSDKRRLELRNSDGTIVLASSVELASFDSPGATVNFTFESGVELRSGTRYRLVFVNSSAQAATVPVMLASTTGAGGYLACTMSGKTGEQTNFFPCVTFTLLRPAPDIAAVITEAKDALAGLGALEFFSPSTSGGSVTLRNRAVNAVTLNGTSKAFVFPSAVEGKGRSFLLRITMSSATAWTLPTGITFESDDESVFADIEAGGTALFIFSEVTAGRFLVSRKTVATVTK